MRSPKDSLTNACDTCSKQKRCREAKWLNRSEAEQIYKTNCRYYIEYRSNRGRPRTIYREVLTGGTAASGRSLRTGRTCHDIK